MKQPRKVALISVHDYNRDNYSAYYEIRVLLAEDEKEGFLWGVRIYSRKDLVKVPRLDSNNAPVFEEFKNEHGEVVTDANTGKPVKVQVFDRFCKILEDVTDVAPTRDDADTAAQEFVINAMKKYKIQPKSANPQAGHAAVGFISGWWILEGLRDLTRRLLGGLIFALAYATTLRNNRMNQVRDAIDAGAGAGLWRIYDGSRPATCGSATTLLAEMTCSDPCAAGASGGVMTFSAVTADASANATGTATWSRIVDSTGTCAVDMSVGTGGSDLNLNSTSIASGQEVSITSATITEGNA